MNYQKASQRFNTEAAVANSNTLHASIHAAAKYHVDKLDIGMWYDEIFYFLILLLKGYSIAAKFRHATSQQKRSYY